MTKSTLETVIKKYYLAGLIETSIWKVADDTKTLRIGSCTPNYVVSAVVDVANFDSLATNEFAVNDTSKLLKMLNVLSDEIKLSTKQTNDKIHGIVMQSGTIELQYVTADIAVLRASKSVQVWNKPDPDYEVEIIVDDEFIETYVASKAALPDSEFVVFQMNADNKLEMVFGYIQGGNKSLNTSKIKYSPKTIDGKNTLTGPLGYNAQYLKEILVANKTITNSVLKLSASTLANIKFVDADITANYHMRGINVK